MLVQITLVTFLPLTRAVPDLVLVTVLALAHHRARSTGGLLGAWAGVLLDLVPPAIEPLGGWTLVLGVAGFVHGHIVATRRPGPLLALVLLAAGDGYGGPVAACPGPLVRGRPGPRRRRCARCRPGPLVPGS